MQEKKHSTLQEKNPSKRNALLELQEELKRMEKKMALLTRPSTVPRAELMVQHWAHKNTAVSQLARADKEPNVHNDARWPMAHLGFHGLESVAKKQLALGSSGEDPFRDASCEVVTALRIKAADDSKISAVKAQVIAPPHGPCCGQSQFF